MNSNRRQFTLRLNAELHKKIETVSDQMGVSANALISMILDREVKQTG